MTKLELINKVVEDGGLNRAKAGETVETIIRLVKETLSRGEPVILRKFWSFEVKSKKKRIGRNPKTGQGADIAPRKVVSFKSGKYFRQAVNVNASLND